MRWFCLEMPVYTHAIGQLFIDKDADKASGNRIHFETGNLKLLCIVQHSSAIR